MDEHQVARWMRIRACSFGRWLAGGSPHRRRRWVAPPQRWRRPSSPDAPPSLAGEEQRINGGRRGAARVRRRWRGHGVRLRDSEEEVERRRVDARERGGAASVRVPMREVTRSERGGEGSAGPLAQAWPGENAHSHRFQQPWLSAHEWLAGVWLGGPKLAPWSLAREPNRPYEAIRSQCC